MAKSVQFNLRIDPDILNGLADIAGNMGVSPNALATKALTDYVQIYAYKIQRGDVTLSKPIIKKIFEAIDPERFDEISEYTANFIVSEIMLQEGKITYEKMLEHFMKWNKGRFQFNRIRQDGTDLIISKHMICRNWSEIQCKMYSRCFELIGETVVKKEFDSDDSYSIQVARHS